MNKAMKKRLWGDTPVFDATSPTTLFVSPMDIRNGIPDDPLRCAVAQTAMRITGSEVAAIFKTAAWIKVPTANGWAMMRYAINEKARKRLDEFDKTGTMDAGGILLQPPKPSQTLDAKDAANAIRKERGKRYPEYSKTGARTPSIPRGGIKLLTHSQARKENK